MLIISDFRSDFSWNISSCEKFGLKAFVGDFSWQKMSSTTVSPIAVSILLNVRETCNLGCGYCLFLPISDCILAETCLVAKNLVQKLLLVIFHGRKGHGALLQSFPWLQVHCYMQLYANVRKTCDFGHQSCSFLPDMASYFCWNISSCKIFDLKTFVVDFSWQNVQLYSVTVFPMAASTLLNVATCCRQGNIILVANVVNFTPISDHIPVGTCLVMKILTLLLLNFNDAGAYTEHLRQGEYRCSSRNCMRKIKCFLTIKACCSSTNPK